MYIYDLPYHVQWNKKKIMKFLISTHHLLLHILQHRVMVGLEPIPAVIEQEVGDNYLD